MSASKKLRVTATADGVLRFIRSDALDGLLHLGEARIRRASHVEPAASVGTEWIADMSPMGGPVMAGFPSHQAAIDAELDWLAQHGY